MLNTTDFCRPLLLTQTFIYRSLHNTIVFVSLLLTYHAAVFAQGPENSPSELVQKVAVSTLDRIKNQKLGGSSKNEDMYTIIEEELMPYVDYKFAAFKVLGSNVRKVSPEELKDFVAAFRSSLISSYSGVLNGLTDHQLEVEALHAIPSGGLVSVKSLVTSSNGPPINIIFKLRLEPKEKIWQLYDIQAEGISLITSKKSELDPIIRKRGIKYAIDLLNSPKVAS